MRSITRNQRAVLLIEILDQDEAFFDKALVLEADGPRLIGSAEADVPLHPAARRFAGPRTNYAPFPGAGICQISHVSPHLRGVKNTHAS